MLSDKLKGEQFKRDLCSVTYHRQKIREINEELEMLAVNLQGVHAASMKEKSRNFSYQDRRMELMVKEDQLVAERKVHEHEIHKVLDTLELLPKEKAELLKEVYIEGRSYDAVANKHYISRDKLKYDLSESLRWLGANSTYL